MHFRFTSLILIYEFEKFHFVLFLLKVITKLEIRVFSLPLSPLLYGGSIQEVLLIQVSIMVVLPFLLSLSPRLDSNPKKRGRREMARIALYSPNLDRKTPSKLPR